MNVGDIVWIDGTTPALVVGQGHDEANIADGRVFVVKLGGVEVIEPVEGGGYPFGNAPYDVKAGDDPQARNVNAGGFGPNSPAVPAESDTPLALVHDGGTPTDSGGYDPAGSDALAVNAEHDAAYTDNGDGTWTRTSDGARGVFTPTGFVQTPGTAS